LRPCGARTTRHTRVKASIPADDFREGGGGPPREPSCRRYRRDGDERRGPPRCEPARDRAAICGRLCPPSPAPRPRGHLRASLSAFASDVPFRGARKIADKKSPLRATSGGRAKGAGRLFVVCVNGFSSGGFRDPNSTDDDDSRRKGIRQVSKSTTHFAPVVVWANSQGEEKRVEIWTSPNLGC
jgi:hypothetical protein